VKDHKSLASALDVLLKDDNLWILNVEISTTSARKEQEYTWLTREEEKEVKPKL
jgi:hypothetical protein